MADGTKAVVDVDTSVADEAALAMALGELSGDDPEEQDDTASTREALQGPAEAPGTPAGPDSPTTARDTGTAASEAAVGAVRAAAPDAAPDTARADDTVGASDDASRQAPANAPATAGRKPATGAKTGTGAKSAIGAKSATGKAGSAPAAGKAAGAAAAATGRTAGGKTGDKALRKASEAAGEAAGGKPAESVAEAADPAADARPAKTAGRTAGSTVAETAGTKPAKTSATATAKATGRAAGEKASEQTSEMTAPLSAVELAGELSADGKAPARKPSRGRRTPQAAEPDRPTAAPATSTETLDADTATLPAVLPAPLRHSGDRIADRYRLEECFSQSDTFTSWRAVDEKLRRAVGVHLLSAGHRRAKAVLTAARSAALLGDPRFVQVLDAVQQGELVYVIREWLPDASDLGRLLASGPMEPYDAHQMVRQVTDAIAAAHRRGQAHLRLTPKCVLRTDSGQYRINGIAVDAALRGLPAEDAELTDVRAIGALLYAALTHRWPYPEDRYDLQGLPKSLGCVPPDQVKAGVHKGLSELAARILCEGHKDPITSPEQLAEAIAAMPRIRQPEQPAPAPLRALPAAARPRYATGQPTQKLPPVEAAPAPAAAAPPAPPVRRRRGLRRAAKLTVSLVALAAIAAGSWQLVDRMHHRDPVAATTTDHAAPAPAPTGTPANPTGSKLAVARLTPFNAYGETKDEHVPELPKAMDGDPTTAWTTQRYEDPFGAGYRPGTGLLIDLGSARPVTSVDLQFLGDHSVELRAAPPGVTNAPNADDAGFRSFGPSVASGSGTRVTLKPTAPVSTRFLLVWLTGTPTDPEGGYRGRIAEIQVNG